VVWDSCRLLASRRQSPKPQSHLKLIYCKTSDRSRAPDRRRAPHTGRGSDSLVPIEAGPRLQAGSRIQAGGGVDAGTDVPLCPYLKYWIQ